MPQITLNADQVRKLSKFLSDNDQKTWFLAKDQGAYVGATNGKKDDAFKNMVFYFKGCDPEKNDDWYDECHYKFGGDDFGEHFDAEFIHKAAALEHLHTVVVKVTATSITTNAFTRKPKTETPTKPLTITEPPKRGEKHNVGTVARAAIAEGYSNDEVLEIVKDTFPDAKTTKSSIAWYRSQMKKAA